MKSMKNVAMKMMIMNVAALFLVPHAFAAEALGKFVGQIGMVQGEVFVDGKAVVKSAQVREGSTIEVKDGKATLLLGSGSVFHLAAQTKMQVKEFGIQADSKKEGGKIDLKFGRTRALVLNKGTETKDIKINTRTATMGVRGTEIFIDAPQDTQRPVQFFTMEGLAQVEVPNGATVPLPQNQGVATNANVPNNGAVNTSTAVNAPTVTTSAPAMSVAQVNDQIHASGMQLSAMNTVNDMKQIAGVFTAAEIPKIPSPNFDPVADKPTVPITIKPTFCNGTAANCP